MPRISKSLKTILSSILLAGATLCNPCAYQCATGRAGYSRYFDLAVETEDVFGSASTAHWTITSGGGATERIDTVVQDRGSAAVLTASLPASKAIEMANALAKLGIPISARERAGDGTDSKQGPLPVLLTMSLTNDTGLLGMSSIVRPPSPPFGQSSTPPFVQLKEEQGGASGPRTSPVPLQGLKNPAIGHTPPPPRETVETKIRSLLLFLPAFDGDGKEHPELQRTVESILQDCGLYIVHLSPSDRDREVQKARAHLGSKEQASPLQVEDVWKANKPRYVAVGEIVMQHADIEYQLWDTTSNGKVPVGPAIKRHRGILRLHLSDNGQTIPIDSEKLDFPIMDNGQMPKDDEWDRYNFRIAVRAYGKLLEKLVSTHDWNSFGHSGECQMKANEMGTADSAAEKKKMNSAPMSSLNTDFRGAPTVTAI